MQGRIEQEIAMLRQRFPQLTPKVDIGARIVTEIDPALKVHKHQAPLLSTDAFEAIIKASCVFGCLDNEGMRLVLNELCAAYAKPYFDLASDIVGTDEFGGRICAAIDGEGCVICRALLDLSEAQEDLAKLGEKRDREAIYGVDRENLGDVGPSVVSINGAIASLAVTEFMLHTTGIRKANGLTYYRGHSGRVTVSIDPPMSDCYYCRGIRGHGEAADVQRYLRS